MYMFLPGLDIYLEVELLGHEVILSSNLMYLPYCFPHWPQFIFKAPYEVSNFFTSLPTLDILHLLCVSHLGECEVVSISLCCFLLSQVTNDTEQFFHMLIGRLYIFFVEMSIQTLCLSFNWIVFLLLSYKNFLYFMDVSSSLDRLFQFFSIL